MKHIEPMAFVISTTGQYHSGGFCQEVQTIRELPNGTRLYAGPVNEQELVDALTAITRSFIIANVVPFPQCLPQVQAAMKAIARANGKSIFGNDWMDAIEDCPL